MTFDQAVRDPDGDSEVNDVTNPANYRLVVTGDDQDLATEACDALSGDDETLAIAGVSYDAGTNTAEIQAQNTLPDSAQRLLVCSSILDPAGNPLSGGIDFARTFRIERQNLFVNGQLDCDLDSWTAVSTTPEEIEYDPSDVDDAAISGSAAVSNLTSSTDFSFGQCLPIVGGFSYDLGAAVQMSAASGVTVFLSRTCEFFAASACSGTTLTSTVEIFPVEDSAGAWQQVESEILAPDGSSSALCSFDFLAPARRDLRPPCSTTWSSSNSACPFSEMASSRADTSAWTSSTP